MVIQKPSKKIISLLIVCLAIIGGILIVNRKITPSKASLSYSVTDINTFNSANAEDNSSQNLDNLLGVSDSTSTDATDTANTSDLVARSLFSGYKSLSESGDTSADSQQVLATNCCSAARKILHILLIHKKI